MTNAKHSNFYKRHMNAIKSGTYPEGLIQGYRRAYHSADRQRSGWSTGATAAKTKGGELSAIWEAITEHKPRVEAAQEEKGIAYLRNVWRTPKGAERQRNPFGPQEQAILEAFDHFRLVDFWDVGRHHSFIIPVYRVVARDGSYFDYYCAAWQSGGSGPIIV